MTYIELQDAVRSYLEVYEPTFDASMPLFVRAVENRIYNAVQLPALRKNMTGAFAAGNRYLAMPPDFLAAFSLAVVDEDSSEYEYMQQKDVNLIREMYPSPAAVGKPRVYGMFDTNTLIVGPTPDKAYAAELHFFYYPESIVTAGTSWIGTNFPSVLLYGVIAEGYRFQKGAPAQQAIYDQQYTDALNLLRGLGESKQRGDAFTTQTRKFTITVGE